MRIPIDRRWKPVVAAADRQPDGCQHNAIPLNEDCRTMKGRIRAMNKISPVSERARIT
jgi:hypothetical protein